CRGSEGTGKVLRAIRAEGARMETKIYWEDLPVGKVIDLGTREVPREEVLDFARRYDPQPFHTDEEAAKKSIYGGLIASGWHTCAMMMRLLYDGLLKHAASLGSPGVDTVRDRKSTRLNSSHQIISYAVFCLKK